MKRTKQVKRTVLCLTAAILVLICSSCGKAEESRWYDGDTTKLITVGEYRGIAYTPAQARPVGEEDVKAYIDAVLEENSYEEEITSGVYEMGDELKLDFKGDMNGETAISFDGYGTLIGADGFFSDFDGGLTGLVGMTVAKEHTLNLSYKADHANEELAGKTVTFTLTIHSVIRHHDAVLDDAFVQKIASVGTVEEYRQSVRRDLETQAVQAAHEKDLESVWSAVVAGSTLLDYPKGVLNSYTEYLNAFYEKQAQEAGLNTEDFLLLYYGFTPEDIPENARKIIKQDLVMYTLCNREKLSFDEKEYQSYAKLLAEERGLEDAKQLENVYSREYVEKALLLSKLQEHLLTLAIPQDPQPPVSTAPAATQAPAATVPPSSSAAE